MALSDWNDDQGVAKADIDESIVASDIPDGPDDTSISSDSVDPTPGDTITAEWTNVSGSSGMHPQANWYVNDTFYTSHKKAEGATSDSLDTSGLNSGDDIKCRVNYVLDSGEVVGTKFGNSIQKMATGDEINTNLVMNSDLSPLDDAHPRGDIESGAKQSGASGAFSNTITLT